MWQITGVGRQLIRQWEVTQPDRLSFCLDLGLSRNMVRLLLDKPEHRFRSDTIRKLQAFSAAFRTGVHCVSEEKAAGDEIQLVRDQPGSLPLTRQDFIGLELLYKALLQNPEFAGLFPTFDSVSEFRKWLIVFGNARDDLQLEQFVVFRSFQTKIIACLCGDLHKRSDHCPLEIFAIWYLIGTSNAVYENSPVGLPPATAALLPAGEREAAIGLTVKLLEELRQAATLDYIFFEVDAAEAATPHSLTRRLLRLYTQAAVEVKRRFADDRHLCNCEFYVLDCPYVVPHMEANGTVITQRHLLVCCPMKPAAQRAFANGAVPQSMATKLLRSVYSMYWEYLDVDAPEREPIRLRTEEALGDFERFAAAHGEQITSLSLRGYSDRFFRGGGQAA